MSSSPSPSLPYIEVNPKDATPRLTIIWLHGLGADGHDFESIAPQLDIAESHQIRFLFPHAPVQPVSINGGQLSRAWFDIYGSTVNSKIDLAGIETSRKMLESLIYAEMARGIESKNICLVGFSQGATMVLNVGLQFPEPLAGIIALSGYLPGAEKVIANQSPANKNIPIFLAHGTADSIIPYPLGLELCETLIRANLPISWHSYFMPHTVCDDEINDIREWLLTRAFP